MICMADDVRYALVIIGLETSTFVLPKSLVIAIAGTD